MISYLLEPAEERPPSKASSTKSAGSVKETPVNGAPSEPTETSTEKKSVSRQSSKQSSRGQFKFRLCMMNMLFLFIPPTNIVWGVYRNHPVCLSVRPSVCPHSL